MVPSAQIQNTAGVYSDHLKLHVIEGKHNKVRKHAVLDQLTGP